MDEFSSYIWLDVEASGLHRGSYPVEIGWCDSALVASSFLIKPLPTWTVEEWSPSSERIHGISRQVLSECGLEASDIAGWLNAAMAGKTVLSDNPEFDQRWLSILFFDTNVKQEFTIYDAAQLERQAALQSRLPEMEAQSLLERIKRRFPHPHRAGPDARRAAACYLALAIPHELDRILQLA